MGVVKADPQEYYNKYKSILTHSSKLPDFVKEMKPPEGILLAADYSPITYELEGDIDALRLVDLDREGLSEYRSLLKKNHKSSKSSKSSKLHDKSDKSDKSDSSKSSSSKSKSSTKTSNLTSSTQTVIESIFNVVDIEKDGEITMSEANDIFERLNQRIGRVYKPDELRKYLKTNKKETRKNDKINLNDFKEAFQYFARE